MLIYMKYASCSNTQTLLCFIGRSETHMVPHVVAVDKA